MASFFSRSVPLQSKFYLWSVLKCGTDSNNPCTEDELKESIYSVVLVVLPAEHQYEIMNMLCCTHVREMNEAISITLLLLLFVTN
jgi:hypothetical protein